jgi:regulatory protein
MDSPKTNKIIDEDAARSKAEHYCAYQERSQQEVRDKLYEWGQYPNIVEDIISGLITGNFLNEERFAKAYAIGKFRQKGWGKNMIKRGLKLKKVPDVLINKALQAIPGDEYLKMLEKILIKKAATVTEKGEFMRLYKLQRYALVRGYENDLIIDVLKPSFL